MKKTALFLSVLLSAVILVAMIASFPASAAQSDDSVGASLKINISSNFFGEDSVVYKDDIPGKVTVDFYCAAEVYTIINGQYTVNFDPKVLKLNESSNKIIRRSISTLCPVSDSVSANYSDSESGLVKFSFSDGKGDALAKISGSPIAVVHLVFDVVGSGETSVDLEVFKQTFKFFNAETDPDTWFVYYSDSQDGGAAVKNQLVNSGVKIYMSFSPEGTVIAGDVNGDGRVTIDDATETQKYLARRVELSNAQMKAADADGDGRITIDDATQIQKFLAHMIGSLA